MKLTPPAPLVVNGWALFAHPLFLERVETLLAQVEALRQKYPADFIKKNTTKRLAVITRLAFEVIPQDPGRAEYQQEATLGDQRKHWHRAKFFQQYRLFFRYHRISKIIIYAWVNDEDSKRAYESGDDASQVFRHMLKSGHPPDGWQNLLAETQHTGERLNEFVEKLTDIRPR